MNDLQQLFGIQIGQPPVEQEQLAFAILQLAQSIGPAQSLGRGDARQRQVLQDLLAKTGVRTGNDNRWIGGMNGCVGVVMQTL